MIIIFLIATTAIFSGIVVVREKKRKRSRTKRGRRHIPRLAEITNQEVAEVAPAPKHEIPAEEQPEVPFEEKPKPKPESSKFPPYRVAYGPDKDVLCPNCRNPMKPAPFNVPVFRANGSFYAFYNRKLLYCTKCGMSYMPIKVFEDIVKSITAGSKGLHIKPENMRIRMNVYDQQFLYDPIAKYTLIIDIDAWKESQYNKYSSYDKYSATPVYTSAFNAESFLKVRGYDTFQSEKVRHQILDDAIEEFGIRAITDHLNMCIRLHVKHPRAQKVWRSDLDYIAERWILL